MATAQCSTQNSLFLRLGYYTDGLTDLPAAKQALTMKMMFHAWRCVHWEQYVRAREAMQLLVCTLDAPLLLQS